MNKRRIGRNRGFTLIELLIVCGMLGIVVAAVYSLYVTSMRSANVQEDVADVQQNLRIAMDSITRDIRIAGFLVTPSINGGVNFTINPAGPFAETTPPRQLPAEIAAANDSQGVMQLLPPPDNIPSDMILLNVASPASVYASVSQPPPLGAGTFIVVQADDADRFNIGDQVTVIRPQPNKSEPGDAGAILTVTGTNPNAPSITLAGGNAAANYQRGDMITRLDATLTRLPNFVMYCLGSRAGVPLCGGKQDTCPVGHLCLMRIANGAPSVVANSIAGFKIQYLFADANVPMQTNVKGASGAGVSGAANYIDLRSAGANSIANVRAVRVTITGMTFDTAGLSGANKVRQMESIVQLKNRADL